MTNDERWKDSVCACCGKAECFGGCPGYAEWERAFLEAQQWGEAESHLLDEPDMDEIKRELDKL